MTNKMNSTQLTNNGAHGGLHSPNLFAKWPVLGWTMFILGSLLFGGLAYNLYFNGPLLALDRVIANTWPAIALKGPAYLKGLMEAGFYIGDHVIIGLGVILGIYFIFKRYWQELVMVTIGLVGSSGLFLALSNLIDRVRPSTQIWIVEKIPGFPSGHAITVVVFYGLLAYLLVPKMRTGFGKFIVILAALLIIGFVGFSRVFTGGHYLTDVLAGYALGIAWSGMAYGLIENYFKKRRSQNVKKK
jgi:membrane-associated phospholipid phosphatase